MRVLVLTTDAFGGHGGIAKYNRDLLSAVCSHARTVEVVAIARDAVNELEPLPRKLTFVTDGIGTKRNFVAAVVRRMLHVSSYDLVLCGHINLLPLALVVAKRFGAPLVLWAYGIDVWNRPNSWAAAKACSYIDGVAAISQITADRFRSWSSIPDKKVWIVPNAIELDRFTPGPKDPGLIQRYGLSGRIVIATLGRLVASERMKGIDEVLDALPRLAVAHPDISYIVMGDGSDKARLEQKAVSLGVGNRVIFTGRIAEHEKILHYRLADAYVMPSQGEGFGFVFLEALACGVPVVASKTDGGREAVRGGELGTLVDPSDRDDVIRGIEEALAKPRGVVPDGLRHFSYDKFRERVHGFLDQMWGI